MDTGCGHLNRPGTIKAGSAAHSGLHWKNRSPKAGHIGFGGRVAKTLLSPADEPGSALRGDHGQVLHPASDAPTSRSAKLAPRLHEPHRCPAKQFGKPNNLFGQPTFRWGARNSRWVPLEPPGCRDPAMARGAGAHFARIDAEGLRYPCRMRCSLGVMSKRSLKAVAKSPDRLTPRPEIRSFYGNYYVFWGPP